MLLQIIPVFDLKAKRSLWNTARVLEASTSAYWGYMTDKHGVEKSRSINHLRKHITISIFLPGPFWDWIRMLDWNKSWANSPSNASLKSKVILHIVNKTKTSLRRLPVAKWTWKCYHWKKIRPLTWLVLQLHKIASSEPSSNLRNHPFSMISLWFP